MFLDCFTGMRVACCLDDDGLFAEDLTGDFNDLIGDLVVEEKSCGVHAASLLLLILTLLFVKIGLLLPILGFRPDVLLIGEANVFPFVVVVVAVVVTVSGRGFSPNRGCPMAILVVS